MVLESLSLLRWGRLGSFASLLGSPFLIGGGSVSDADKTSTGHSTGHPPDTPPDSMDGNEFESVLGFVQLCLHAVCVCYHVLMVS